MPELSLSLGEAEVVISVLALPKKETRNPPRKERRTRNSRNRQSNIQLLNYMSEVLYSRLKVSALTSMYT